MTSKYRIAFTGWNPFQLHYVKDIIRIIPESCYLLGRRNKLIHKLPSTGLSDPDVPILFCDYNELDKYDGMFDVLVCQTPIPKIWNFLKTKIAFLQYGYAKEAHNYGAWRSLADLNMVFGPYAEDKIKYFSPVTITGSPLYDLWSKAKWRQSVIEKYTDLISPVKKTILYAPTWGKLSTISNYWQAINSLSNNYNVIVKLHHNTDLLDTSRKNIISKDGIQIFGSDQCILELMAISDVVISDYSGAIFDALFCQKKIILLNKQAIEFTDKKVDEFSLEIRQRSKIGLQVNTPDQLPDIIYKTLQSPLHVDQYLYQQLFAEHPGALERIKDSLYNLINGQYRLNQQQLYVRQAMQKALKVDAELKEIKKKPWVIAINYVTSLLNSIY